MDSSLGNITPRIGHGRQNADLSLPFCSYKLTPTQRVIFHRSLSHCAERYPCLLHGRPILKCGLKSANGRDVTKRAIGLINVDYIVSGRNYDILDPIIAQMLTSRPTCAEVRTVWRSVPGFPWAPFVSRSREDPVGVLHVPTDCVLAPSARQGVCVSLTNTPQTGFYVQCILLGNVL